VFSVLFGNSSVNKNICDSLVVFKMKDLNFAIKLMYILTPRRQK